MERVSYESLDGTIKWFDKEEADEIEEGTNWDGNNHISLATGTQWNHEILFKTRKGSWVLNHWSQMQGSVESWMEISDDDAIQWLLKNGRDIPDGLSVDELEG